MACLSVCRLHLTDFRCYDRLELVCDRRPVVLTGPNGAGKTNLLEAVSFLAPGRGLRRARLAVVDRHGGGPWAAAARLEGLQGPVDIGTGRDGDSERRLVRIDHAPARSQASLAEHVALAWLTPDLDRLFQEGASPRRRFLDRLVYGFDPGHAARVSAYDHALRERARLLRLGRHDPAWLGVLEERMAAQGVAIAAARRATVDRLNAADLAVDAFPRAVLAAEGDVEAWLDDGPALAAEDRLRDALAAARGRDAEAGGARTGPHRSDLAVHRAADRVAARDGSTGEQKALLVSIHLAAARLMTLERGRPPLLLLDEVAAHLDARRRAALFDQIVELGAQAWLTGTDRVLFAGLEGRARFFDVCDATVRPANAGAE